METQFAQEEKEHSALIMNLHLLNGLMDQ